MISFYRSVASHSSVKYRKNLNNIKARVDRSQVPSSPSKFVRKLLFLQLRSLYQVSDAFTRSFEVRQVVSLTGQEKVQGADTVEEGEAGTDQGITKSCQVIRDEWTSESDGLTVDSALSESADCDEPGSAAAEAQTREAKRETATVDSATEVPVIETDRDGGMDGTSKKTAAMLQERRRQLDRHELQIETTRKLCHEMMGPTLFVKLHETATPVVGRGLSFQMAGQLEALLESYLTVDSRHCARHIIHLVSAEALVEREWHLLNDDELEEQERQR
jgi:hypothetical protein